MDLTRNATLASKADARNAYELLGFLLVHEKIKEPHGQISVQAFDVPVVGLREDNDSGGRFVELDIIWTVYQSSVLRVENNGAYSKHRRMSMDAEPVAVARKASTRT